MTTRGRTTKAMNRAHELYELIKEIPGQFNAYYTEALGCTKGERQTAMRYLREDKLIRQEGKNRGARFYAVSDERKRPTTTEMVGMSKDDTVSLTAKWTSDCSYCMIAPVIDLLVYPDNGMINFEDVRNKATAVRQSFHLCHRCYDLRMPTHAKYEQDRKWIDRYPEWDGTSSLREQKVFKFIKWVYSPDETGETSLYGRVVPLGDNGDNIGASEIHIRFTFQRTADGTSADDKQSISFARGYKYFHKIYGHPNSLWDRKVVVSREPHKKSNGKWFWSWTPYPRIPLHIKRQLDLDNTADTDTLFDTIVPEDVSLPAHQIHSIMAEGDFTVIRVRKGSDEYKHKFQRLHDAILAFLAGEIGLGELELSIVERD